MALVDSSWHTIAPYKVHKTQFVMSNVSTGVTHTLAIIIIAYLIVSLLLVRSGAENMSHIKLGLVAAIVDMCYSEMNK